MSGILILFWFWLFFGGGYVCVSYCFIKLFTKFNEILAYESWALSTFINILICKCKIPALQGWYNFVYWSLTFLPERLLYFEYELFVRKLGIFHSPRHHRDLRGDVSFVNIHYFMYTSFCLMPCHKRKIHAVLLPKEEIFFPYLSRPVKVTSEKF